MRFALALGFLIGAMGLVAAEEYRLVHAIDDNETTIRKGLLKTSVSG